MKKYTSLEELMGGCSHTKLKSLVSSVLRNDRYMEWSFVSGSVFGDARRADFVSKLKFPDFEQRLTCVEDESGVRWDISTTVPASTVA